MERVYTNHRTGERRIHVEIEEAEVRALAAGDTAATERLRKICADAGQAWPAQDGSHG
ncbi:hypothetical protein [Streptomyces bangladeshensis]|uniref:Uncharacterized protein n=1 Tax=Streptomyces bangladeshensis TaxID=295352 RepID=A0ABN3BDJ4_9ACTN